MSGEAVDLPVPSPGSDEAMQLGCNCPRLDNAYGKGAYINDDGVPQYWINGTCPLHGGGPEEEATYEFA